MWRKITENNKINLKFIIKETEKFFVERINIFGNNVTRENVIRNQLELMKAILIMRF